jgi:hypothetical protein
VLAPCAPGCASAPPGAPLEPLAGGNPPETSGFEGDAHGFPALRNLKGESLAEGEFTQWLEGERLHQRIRYDFGSERWIEEQSVIQQEPALVQERWSWVEMRSGAVQRRFDVDFLSGDAAAEKLAFAGADRFRIHAQVPWFARAFVEVPDSRIWLAHPPPAAFLRWEGPLAEPGDALVRVDLLPGEPSGPASPSTP